MRNAILGFACVVLITGFGHVARSDDVDVSAAYQRVLNTVVYITTVDREWNFSFGTGVVIEETGFILTAYHVVGADRMVVAMPPARSAAGELLAKPDAYCTWSPSTYCVVVARDPKRDLALLRLKNPPKGIKALAIAAASPSPGASVFTIGNGEDVMWRCSGGNVRQVYQDQCTFADGQAVSGKMIEMTTPLNPGDSGGPIVNRAGELVGINFAIWSGNQTHKGIDVTEVRRFLEDTAAKLTPK